MNKKIFLILLFILPGCMFDHPNTPDKKPINQIQIMSNADIPTEKNNFLIQLISNSLTFDQVMKNITPIIHSIVKEELGLDQNYDFNFFLPKERQRLTLYYANDTDINGEKIIISTIDSMNLIHDKPTNVFLTSHVEFFGNSQDELVIVIDDQQHELALLNQKIKDKMHSVNKEYIKTNNQELYSIKKSEQFPFMPHMGLGRIRSQSIKDRITDTSQINVVFERIKTRVKQTATDTLTQSLTTENSHLALETLTILNQTKGTYIQEWH